MLRSLTNKSSKSKSLTNTTGLRYRGFVRNDAADEIEKNLENVMGRDYLPYPEAGREYSLLRPELVEPPKLWTLPNKYWNIREKPTSKGERKHSKLEESWLGDTRYQLYRERLDYNKFADSVPISSIRQRYLQNIWTKQYFRDEEGEAVVPDRFKNIDRKGFESYLKKADHYFFGQNVPPKLRVYTPLVNAGWPEDMHLAEDKVTKELREKENNNGKITSRNIDLGTAMQDAVEAAFEPDSDKTLGGEIAELAGKKKLFHAYYPEHSTSSIVRRFHLDRENFLSERVRRVREWQSFLARMKYVCHLNTKRVSCVRSIGRDSHIITLFLMGDGEGFFTYGIGKGLDEPEAYRRALYACRKNALYIPLFEKRTLFQDADHWFGQSRVRLFGLHRGAGFTCSQRYLTWFKSIGIKDGGMKLTGTKNMYCLIKAFMQCLEDQTSYREIAFGRGVDYRRLDNPFHKTPPAPSHEDIKDLEAEAAKNFSKAITEVMNKRGILETRTYAPMKPYFLNYDPTTYHQAWDATFDAKNVPKDARIYPSFTDFIDASAYVASVDDNAAATPYDNLPFLNAASSIIAPSP